MRETKISFVGGGRVAKIMLGGWAKAGQMPAEIVVSDLDAGALARLASAFPSVRPVGNDNSQAAGQDIVFLAVHPPHVGAVLADVKSSLKPDAILVSLAPKWTIEKLAGLLNGFTRIARVIPNAPSIVGRGYNPIAYGSSLTEQDRGDLARLFAGLGESPEVEERKLESYAILTAMGPTYLWPQLYELLSLAQSFGLTGTESSAGLAAMVTGAVAAMNDAGLTPEEVQDLIPVKPLAELQSTILEGYRTKLTAVAEKIRP
jgi:pyrroline-5-carboxylate reductase